MKVINRGENVAQLEKLSEINDIIEQTYWYEQKVYELNKKIEKNKDKISKFLGTKGRLEIKVDKNLSFIVTKKVIPKLEFFPDQLKVKLDKEKYKQISIKTSKLKDIDKLVKFLKSYGVPAKEFKKFIEFDEVIDVDKLDYLIEIGEIKIEDLYGCYKAEFEEKLNVKKTK